MHKSLKAFFIFILFAGKTGAQQLPFYSQYRNNLFILNPAIAGTNQTIDFRANQRIQWVGYDGAPATSSVSFHSRFYKGMIGLGGFSILDRIGPNQQTHYNLSAAYHLRFPDVELSIGAAGYLTQYTLNGNNMTLHDYYDPHISTKITTTTWAKNVGAGTYLYNDRFNIGISASHYFEPELKVFTEDTTKEGIIKYITHANFILGYNYVYNKDLNYENNFYANYVSGLPIALDYMFRVHIKNMFYFGGSIRIRDAIVIHAGYTFLKHFRIGYSYDVGISRMRNYNSGSHEISFIFSHPLRYSRDKFLKQKYSNLF